MDRGARCVRAMATERNHRGATGAARDEKPGRRVWTKTPSRVSCRSPKLIASRTGAWSFNRTTSAFRCARRPDRRRHIRTVISSMRREEFLIVDPGSPYEDEQAALAKCVDDLIREGRLARARLFSRMFILITSPA